MERNDSVLKTLEYPKVLSLLAECTATSLGKEQALALLPQTDFNKVQHALDETDEAFKILNAATAPPFGGMSDVSAYVRKAALGSILEPGDISLVGQMLFAVRRMKEFFAPLAQEKPLLADIAAGLTPARRLEDEIEMAISSSQTVKDDASPELARIRREIRNNQNRVKEKLESILRSSEYQKYFQDQLVTMRGDRYVIPVKQEYRQFFPGIVHDQSGSGATVFIEPLSVVEMNNDVKKMLADEKEEVERILRMLSGHIAKNSKELLDNIKVMTTLDLIFAKARLAQKQKAFPPLLDSGSNIVIKKGRHPLIDANVVVPIDVCLGGNIKTLVITGSNAGGKTVTLKIIGLFALMTQSGLFLPAGSETTMPVFEQFFADIGDEQSIEQSLSTFSGQMRNISQIVNKAKLNALILFDEICAGTDPKEGAALAMAILDTLYAKGAITVLTTHYSELKTFAFQKDGMENASVEFDNVSLEPTYRILMGLPGSSNAFHIAARLGLDSTIVGKARNYLDDEHQKMEDVLRTLELERKEYAEKNSELEKIRLEAKQLKERIAKQEQDISSKKREIIDKYRSEAAETVRQARLEAENAIKEIKALHQQSDSKTRQRVIDGVRKKLVAPELLDEQINEGQQLTQQTAALGKLVYIPSLRQKGTIVGISNNDVTVQMGLLKSTLPMDKVVLTNERSVQDVPKTGRKRATRELAKMTDFRSEIDVRGKTIEEAILDLDKYIDDAVIANVRQVRIIHGKGTGALRKGLTEYFDKHPSVRAHDLAALNEGGSGATVLFL